MSRFSLARITLLWITFFYLVIYFFIQINSADEQQKHVFIKTPSVINSINSSQSIVNYVKKTVFTLSYSTYKLGGSKFDAIRGIYVIDCSSYVDHLLKNTVPHAYQSLINAIGDATPNTKGYYDFFVNLAHKANPYWSKVDTVSQLHPGDILVFRNKIPSSSHASGHVMVIMSTPVPKENAYVVRVADSAPVGHTDDTRQHKSGIGIGTLVLKANPQTGKPDAYAWKETSRWNSSVKFAMARPKENPLSTPV